MSLHMSLMCRHTHIWMHTHTPHTPWETGKGLISFGECREAGSTCQKFKDTLPHEVSVSLIASGVSQVWLAALVSSPDVLENNPAFSNLQCLKFHETRPLQGPPFSIYPTLSWWKWKRWVKTIGFKLNIQNTRIIASGPITSWQIEGETVETVRNFIFGSSKITTDGDCSHETKRLLFIGRKAMTNLDSIFKSRHITLPTKVYLVKDMVFPVVMYGCESWTIKKAECWRIDAFGL